MIDRIRTQDGSLHIRQWDHPPSVYLDHWAMMLISEDATLANVFIRTLKAQNGCLCVSWLNFTEFAKVDRKQQEFAEAFLDAVLPNMIFLEPTPFVVIEREDKLLAGDLRVSPHIDAEFGKALLIGATNSIKPLSAHRLLQYAASPELVEKREHFTTAMITRIEELRARFRTDPQFAKQVKNYVHKNFVQHGTRQIFREISRPLIMDSSLILTPQHIIDLVHAIVPAAYCDFLLLDSHWATQVEQTRRRFRKAGITSFPMAAIYCGKQGDVQRFLDDLAAYQIDKQPKVGSPSR